jgi:hypothetical protein
MAAFCDYLSPIADSCRKLIPGVKILMTVDQTSHLRGRIMWETVRSYTFYDGITPHIYITPKNYSELATQLKARLTQYGNTPLYITEWNWNYPSDDSNMKYTGYEFEPFRRDFINELKKYPNVKAAMFHTWWMGISSYGWLKDEK